MKYVFLAYEDKRHRDVLSATEREVLKNICLANDETLRNNGHLLAVEDLHSSHTATTVRVRDGKVSLTDGAVAGTKEHLAGLFFINARDLNEAIHVASQMPQTRSGPIEVRPIMEFDQK